MLFSRKIYMLRFFIINRIIQKISLVGEFKGRRQFLETSHFKPVSPIHTLKLATTFKSASPICTFKSVTICKSIFLIMVKRTYDTYKGCQFSINGRFTATKRVTCLLTKEKLKEGRKLSRLPAWSRIRTKYRYSEF